MSVYKSLTIYLQLNIKKSFMIFTKPLYLTFDHMNLFSVPKPCFLITILILSSNICKGSQESSSNDIFGRSLICISTPLFTLHDQPILSLMFDRLSTLHDQPILSLMFDRRSTLHDQPILSLMFDRLSTLHDQPILSLMFDRLSTLHDQPFILDVW
jgi:hypothetical protein